MKILTFGLVAGFALATLIPAANASSCTSGAHRAKCVGAKHTVHARHFHRHRVYQGEVVLAEPPPYSPYYFPYLPAAVGIPPGYPPPNGLKWLMEQEDDIPFS